MLPAPDLYVLQATLAAERVTDWRLRRAQLSAASKRREDLTTSLASNPFCNFQVDQIAAWGQAISQYDGMIAAKAEVSSQQTVVAASLVEEGKKNYLLKVKDGFYAKALDEITQVYLKDQEDTLTDGYAYIYQKSKAVTLDMAEERGKRVIKLTLTSTENGESFQEGVEDEGFSVQVTLGTILLVHFIVSYNLPRVIFFDESFGGHEDGTLERFMVLLQQFRDVLGFTFVIVTHDKKRMVPYADRIYSAKDGRYRLVAKDAVYDEAEDGDAAEGGLP